MDDVSKKKVRAMNWMQRLLRIGRRRDRNRPQIRTCCRCHKRFSTAQKPEAAICEDCEWLEWQI